MQGYDADILSRPSDEIDVLTLGNSSIPTNTLHDPLTICRNGQSIQISAPGLNIIIFDLSGYPIADGKEIVTLTLSRGIYIVGRQIHLQTRNIIYQHMKKLFTTLCIVTTLITQASVPVLRFKQYTQRQSDGLVRNNAPRPMPAGTPLKVSTEGMPELVANCILSNPGYGMYSLKAAEGKSMHKLADTPAFEGGAVYVNGKYYACSYDYDSSHTLTMMKWYTYDALTWTLLSERDNPLDFSYIATDRTYDQSSGKVYSISYDKTGQSIWLSTTDVKTGTPTMIAPLQKDVITIAANKKGELYGIDTNANLYKISPADASLTLIGNTAFSRTTSLTIHSLSPLTHAPTNYIGRSFTLQDGLMRLQHFMRSTSKQAKQLRLPIYRATRNL